MQRNSQDEKSDSLNYSHGLCGWERDIQNLKYGLILSSLFCAGLSGIVSAVMARQKRLVFHHMVCGAIAGPGFFSHGLLLGGDKAQKRFNDTAEAARRIISWR